MPIVVTQQAVQKIVFTFAPKTFPPTDFLNLPYRKVKINFGKKREANGEGGGGGGGGGGGEGHHACSRNKAP